MKKLFFLTAGLLLLALGSCTKEAFIMSDEEAEALYEAIDAQAEANHEDVAEEDNFAEMEAAILELVNDHRAGSAKGKLEFCSVAYTEGNKHTDYMIATGKLSHDHFSKRAQRISQKRNVRQVSENVARGYESAQEVVNHWLGSPDHRRSIEGNYTYTAVSVKEDAAGNLYFTQIFYR